MSDTSFTALATKIRAAWLNVVNKLAYYGRSPSYAISTGTANAYVLTLTATSLYDAYVDGDEFTFKANFANTGAATLTILGASTLAAKDIYMGGAALSAGQIQIGDIVRVKYDGTRFQVIGGYPLARHVSSGSGAVARTVQAKLRDFAVSPEDFGAVADGTTDDAAAFQAALDAIKTAGGGTLYLPGSTYKIGSQLDYDVSGASSAQASVRVIGRGRWRTLVTYTGTSGYCFSVTGTTTAADGTGLAEGTEFSHFRLVGTGQASGNTDGGIYVQGFQYLCMEDLRVESFGQDGIRVDRLYYQEAPDASLDDRGAFVTLTRVHALKCGRHSAWLGGSTSTDYSIDHLVTTACHFSEGTTTGLKINAANWVDNASVFHGASIGCHIYGLGTTHPILSIVWNASRCEAGSTDSNLTIEQCRNFIANCALFLANATPNPATGVKLATSASFSVGMAEFNGCSWQNHTTAMNVDGTGGVTNVRVVDPVYSSVTTKIANANSKRVQLIEGFAVNRVTGGGVTVDNNVTGLSDGIIERWYNANDAQPFMHVDSTNFQLGLGPGGSTAIDLLLQRGLTGDGTTAALQSNKNIRLAGPVHIMSGADTPEGAVTATVGSIFLRTNGTAGATFYVKESGTGNTGWAAK